MQNRPTWLPAQALPDLTTDPLHTSWLNERGSLTARLRETWGEVSVDVIEESLTTPLPHEANRLDMPRGEVAWVQVQQLGRQPLGELLFRATDLERSAFEWCADADWTPPDGTAASEPPLARRCVFRRDGAPLLLTEVFLNLDTDTPR